MKRLRLFILGGTPAVLTSAKLILIASFENYTVIESPEITLKPILMIFQ
jgi:hypothetical protein